MDNSFRAGGVFTTEHKRHPLMIRAVESGDSEKITWTDQYIRKNGLLRKNYELIAADSSHNLITTEGLNNLLNVWCKASTPVSAWYIALFDTNSNPAITWTGALFPSTNTSNGELNEYDELTRALYNLSGNTVSGGSISNSANQASFTISNGYSGTLYGAALLSGSAKQNATGTLYAATRFTAARAVVATDIINIQYTLTVQNQA